MKTPVLLLSFVAIVVGSASCGGYSAGSQACGEPCETEEDCVGGYKCSFKVVDFRDGVSDSSKVEGPFCGGNDLDLCRKETGTN